MPEYIDSGTIPIKITPSGVENAQFNDAATVYIDIVVSGAEIHGRPSFEGEGMPWNRFSSYEAENRFELEENITGELPVNERFVGVMRPGGNLA